MRYAVLLLALLLAGQSNDCNRAPEPPPGKSAWCHGLDDPRFEVIANGYKSVNRRSTVGVVNVGRGYYTGVAIGPRSVLTSAHAMPPPGTPIRVDVRTNNEVLDRFDVTHYVVHPGYDPNKGKWYEADLAILTVGRDLPPPYAKLFHPQIHAKGCRLMVAQGIGGSEKQFPTYTLAESHYFVERQDTNNGRPWLLISRAVVIPGGTRKGDSGGGLYAKVGDEWLLVGILSMGWPEAARSGHIWPWHYGKWIDEQLQRAQ